MTTTAGTKQRQNHERWLLEVTEIPTAAGREQRVIAWVEDWVSRRKNLKLNRDKAGNLLLTQKIVGRESKSAPKPICITAHMDHPAFVVREVVDERTLVMEFRGGVNDPYFDDAAVEVFDSEDTAWNGRVVELNTKTKPFKTVQVELAKSTHTIWPGDVGRWRFTGAGRTPEIRKGLLHAPACDDVAAVAAALCTLDVLRNRKRFKHVGVLLTRAEEVGFIGAIAACKYKSVPKRARLICLENSRSFAESPIGSGPILRVGDKASVFEPVLTNRIGAIMETHATKYPEFKWQRRLMPGGTCEATTFSAYGYTSTCLCLPLGNYHNMAEIDEVAAGKRPARVAPECISVDDYHGLIEMLVVVAGTLDNSDGALDLRTRMDRLFDDRRFVLDEG